MWVKYVYNTTQVLYKGVLKQWLKGTGGGSGLTTILNSWDDEKLNKYSINIDMYDHININKNRLSILLHHYCNQQKLYPTVICLMDKACNYLLASRNDPLKCRRGKPDMDEGVVSVVTTASKPPQKANTSATGIDAMIKSVVDYCTKGGDYDTKKENEK